MLEGRTLEDGSPKAGWTRAPAARANLVIKETEGISKRVLVGINCL